MGTPGDPGVKFVGTDTDHVRRALAAYFRSGGRDQPTSDSVEVEYKGLRYVVLRSASGPLAVYRVRNDGILKGMRRWPQEIEEAPMK